MSALRMGPTRRSELLDRIAEVSDKVLTESLRRLASRGPVARTTQEGDLRPQRVLAQRQHVR
ncbi:winged helix-turn-helix transcriptional regulator [Amycolatopsis sp. lyj-23]|uniref:winged helix-turn-helix transcriptional regulator n=1 Tax=Amycolatopsis sp. lyj-23 TaxID=2789283 RepID=UPI00397B2A5C